MTTTASVPKEVTHALSMAKLDLMAAGTLVFFATVLLRLKTIFTEDLPTAATDGLSLLFNPAFFMGCNVAERVGLLLHEVMHVALDHMARCGDRDPEVFNIAADYWINAWIKQYGIALPEPHLYDPKYDPNEWTVEEIYDDIIGQKDQLPELPMADLTAPDGAGGSQDPTVKAELNSILVEAAITAQKASDEAWGAVPDSIRRYVDKLLNPKMPWHILLMQFVIRNRKTTRSYRKPNRRFTPKIMVRTPDGYGLEEGAIHFDLSGSITKDQFATWLAEFTGVVAKLKPEKLWLGQFDTELTVDEVTSMEDLNKISFHGGGGTDITPTLLWAQKNKPNWLIIFTDGYFDFPPIDPKVPTIWLVHSNPTWKAPFGKTIQYPLDTD